VTEALYKVIFQVAESLEIPVVLLAIGALAWVTVEAGAYLVEASRSRHRDIAALSRAAAIARGSLEHGNRTEAGEILGAVGRSAAMKAVSNGFAQVARAPGSEPRMMKLLADFDFDCQRRLSRTRLLVRIGPALGLMGTLIPLSPALEGLANGDVAVLADNLRLAFSITVLGLLVGAVAFAISLSRERLYGQEYSDLEFIAAVLTDPEAAAAPDETRHTRPGRSDIAKEAFPR
jgi:biopolymer transport protein ExbB/TolQ